MNRTDLWKFVPAIAIVFLSLMFLVPLSVKVIVTLLAIFALLFMVPR